jgi:predicted O-methyltransferase YrrM
LGLAREGRPEGGLGMFENMKGTLRKILPSWLRSLLFHLALRYTGMSHQKVRRMFEYDHALLPNRYLAELEACSSNLESTVRNTGLSMGYPSWNLLYYTLMCSLSPKKREVLAVETGTNQGFSTIVIAQALKDSGVQGVVHTVDIDEEMVARAKENLAKAGLSQYVKFNVQDSLQYLQKLMSEVEYLDFAFLDSSHDYDHVIKEFEVVYSKVVICKGKVYFDNTTSGGVAKALRYIHENYAGNMIEFANCSWSPPGNVIWQPEW